MVFFVNCKIEATCSGVYVLGILIGFNITILYQRLQKMSIGNKNNIFFFFFFVFSFFWFTPVLSITVSSGWIMEILRRDTRFCLFQSCPMLFLTALVKRISTGLWLRYLTALTHFFTEI